MTSSRRRRRWSAALLLASLRLVAARAQEEAPPAEGLAGDPAWQQVGGFTGVRNASGIDLLANEVFRESRTGDLFQDLGDLQIEVSHDWDVVDLGLQANFKRRVVERHEALPPGALIGADDLSSFQSINSALGKAQLNVDYLKDRIDPAGGGFSSEAGFVITVAQSNPPAPLDLRSSRRIHVGTPAQELREFWKTHGVRFDRHILRDAGRGLVDLLGLLAGQIGAHFEDTEVGAQYFEGFAEPLTIWADLGVPLKPELFRGPASSLRPNDAVSYLVFVEVAPLSAGVDRWGAKVNVKGFLRFLRETTIVKLPDDQVLLRVKNVAAQGVETTPIKVRPELKWLFLRYGYTFLSDRLDNSIFRASQIVYRVDLKNPRAAEAFAYLLKTGHQVRFKPLLEAAQANEGARILSNWYVDGRRREHAFLARFPSWFRTDHRNVSVVKTVETPSETYQEATHARYQNYRQTWGRDRWRSTRALLTLQSEHLPRTDQDQPPPAPPAALTVSTQVRDKTADPRKLSYLVGLLRGILGLNVPTPGYLDLRRGDAPKHEGVTLSLDLHLGPEQIARLQAVDDDTVWRALAEFYLGAPLGDVWLTAEQRRYWTLSGPLRARTGPAAADIGRRFDAWAARHPESSPGPGVLPDAAGGSRRLFLRARAFVARLHALQAASRKRPLCLACWAGLDRDFQDATFLQYLLVRANGGVEASGVGYDAAIWTDGMFRPAHVGNGLRYGADAAPAPVRPVPTTSESNALTGRPSSVSDAGMQSTDARALVPDVDWIDSSDARLRAGKLYVETASVGGGAPRLRLELFSDYRYAPGLRLRAELRRNRLRADVPLRVQMLDLPQPVEVRESPFMVAQYRYALAIPLPIAIDLGRAYTIYFRVINERGLPVTEEDALRFRVPPPKTVVTPAPAAPAPPSAGAR